MAHVTLKDIAAASGVSAMTVSLALRNSPKVSAARRSEIQQKAKAMGYRPNPMISTLMRQVRQNKVGSDSPAIAYLRESPVTKVGSSHIHTDYFEGAKQRCLERGYTLEEFTLDQCGRSGHRLAQILYTRNIQGLLFAPLTRTDWLASFEWSYFSVAALGYSIQCPNMHRAAAHQYHGVFLLLKALYDLGYRKPGMVYTSFQSERVMHQQLAGLDGFNRQYSPNQSYPTLEIDTDSHTELFTRWYRVHQPDVIVIPWALNLFTKFFVSRSSSNMAIATCGWQSTAPEISGVRQDSLQIGSAGADLVIEQLENNERGVPVSPKTLLIEGSWVKGSSTPAIGVKKQQV